MRMRRAGGLTVGLMLTVVSVARAAGPQAPVYDAGGRRDPFVAPFATTEPAALARPADTDGPRSLRVDDVVVRGVVHSGATWVALLQSPDQKTYLVRTGDPLADGVVTSVTTEAVVFTRRGSTTGTVRKAVGLQQDEQR